MSFADIAEAIREKFRDEVALVASPNLVVTQDNEPPKALAQTWYRLTVLVDTTEQIASGAAGARRYRVTGHAVLNMFRPVAQGDGEMLDLADLVTTAFRSSSITSPAICFEPPPTLSGPVDRADGWFQRTMMIYYDADVFG